jgi:hypothetical protein
MKVSLKLAVFSALILGTMALNGSIKQKLVENAQRNLVETESSTEQCMMPVLTPPSTASFCPNNTGA